MNKAETRSSSRKGGEQSKFGPYSANSREPSKVAELGESHHWGWTQVEAPGVSVQEGNVRRGPPWEVNKQASSKSRSSGPGRDPNWPREGIPRHPETPSFPGASENRLASPQTFSSGNSTSEALTRAAFKSGEGGTWDGFKSFTQQGLGGGAPRGPGPAAGKRRSEDPLYE